jgi:chemotaxis protein CheD
MGEEEIRVGMGDIAVAQGSNTLAIIGLGSCVGVALYVSKSKIGGLAHIMLPDSTKSRPGMSVDKYADTGLAIMLERMRKVGADPLWMTARLVGGASMFKAANNTSAFNIGENNVAACREFLKNRKIRVTGEEVLGTKGRTMRFNLDTGQINVRYVDGHTLEL